MSDKIPAGEDLVVVRSKKRTTKKKTPALTKKLLEPVAVAVESESPPVGSSVAVPPQPPPPAASVSGGLLSSLLVKKDDSGKKDEPALALSLLLSSGMEGEEDEEAIATNTVGKTQNNPATSVSSSEGEASSGGEGASSLRASGEAAGGKGSKGPNWKLGEAFKAAWQSTSSKVTAFVLRNSSSVVPEEELPPPANAREADLRVANYLIRLAAVGLATEVISVAGQNVKLVREGATKHAASLSVCQNDASTAVNNLTKLAAELKALKGFSIARKEESKAEAGRE